MYFIYTFSLALGLVLTFPYYLVRFRNYLPTLPDRFGFLKLPRMKASIWVHAVSVGEIKAVERLLERLRQQFPDTPLVVSTVTPAGQALARERSDIIHSTFYFPIDLPWCVRRVLDRIAPEIVVIAETEIWPNFLRECRIRGIRVMMINGRISDRSFNRYRLIRHWLERVLRDYTIIGMQSETDRQRIEAIGADPQRVTVLGNLKYDAVAAGKPLDAQLHKFMAGWQLIWIAASTMPGEEQLVLDAFAELRKGHPDLKLIIAPRHANRFDAVATMLENARLRWKRRTELPDSGKRPGDVLLLDTIGELAALFHHATVVFIGGSLVATGGHNILEPARHRKPIVFGPHMENFRDMARMFLEAKAAIQIRNERHLAPAIEKLLVNPELALELGSNAHAVLLENAGATDRVLQLFQPVGARR